MGCWMRACGLGWVVLPAAAAARPVPAEALNSVVAIGRPQPDGTVAWAGSGFLYIHMPRPEAVGEARFDAVIVTNRHVVEGLAQAVVRFNPGTLSKGMVEMLPIPLTDEKGTPQWTAHPDPAVEVAVIRFRPTEAFRNVRITHINFVFVKELGAREGTEVLVLGFPIGVVMNELFGANRNYPVARRG